MAANKDDPGAELPTETNPADPPATVTVPQDEWEAMKAKIQELDERPALAAGSAAKGAGVGELPAEMVAAPAAERSAKDTLGDGILVHLMIEGPSSEVERLALLFKASSEDVRQAGRAHSRLVLVGNTVALAG